MGSSKVTPKVTRARKNKKKGKKKKKRKKKKKKKKKSIIIGGGNVFQKGMWVSEDSLVWSGRYGNTFPVPRGSEAGGGLQ